MDASLVDRFAREWRARARGAFVRRALPVADGLVFELQSVTSEPLELGFAFPAGAAWVWGFGALAREELLVAARDAAPDLARPETALGWSDSSATPLDALRAWQLRPAPVHPSWSKLEGARLVDLVPRSGDRILTLRFEGTDPVRGNVPIELVAELFDRGGNLILRAADVELYNRRSRPESPLRAAKESVAPAATESTVDLAAAAHLALAGAAAMALANAHGKETRRALDRVARRLAKLDLEVQAASESESWRQEAELLAANQHRVQRGATQITVEDFFAGGVPREIALDPARSPQENVAELFRRARRLARGRDTIESRRRAASEELESGRAAGEALATSTSWPEVVRAAVTTWRESCPEAASTPLARLWAAGGPASRGRPAALGSGARGAAPRDEGPGRRFVLDGGWEVRVGRSNSENDILTHKFARPDDVWLHASGVAGSHVILRMQGKSENPPRDILEAAASIAARFSKAKHAGTVPVVWTRKRYVRKPRGSPAGLATCTHEKTVFVRPGLPAGTGDDES